jgi:hypothetical protein
MLYVYVYMYTYEYLYIYILIYNNMSQYIGEIPQFGKNLEDLLMIQNQYPSYDPLKTTDFANLPEFRGLNTHLGGYYDDDNTDFTDDIVREGDRGVEGQGAFDPSVYSPSILPDNTDIEDMDIGAIDLSFALSTDLDQDGDVKPYQYGADITDMRAYSPDSDSSFGAQAGLSPNAVAFDPLLGYNGGQNDRKGESNVPLLGYNGEGESDQELKQYYEMLQQQHEYDQYQNEYNQYSQSIDNVTPIQS